MSRVVDTNHAGIIIRDWDAVSGQKVENLVVFECGVIRVKDLNLWDAVSGQKNEFPICFSKKL